MCVSVRLESGDDTDTWKIILDRSIDSVRTTRRTCMYTLDQLVGWLVGWLQPIYTPTRRTRTRSSSIVHHIYVCDGGVCR